MDVPAIEHSLTRVGVEMVEVGIAVPSATSAQTLVQRLVNVFDAEAVSVDRDGKQVLVQAERTVSQTVIEVLSAVSHWLDDGGVSQAQVRVGERTYTLLGTGDQARAEAGDSA